jgi:hypothetical protein
MNLSDNFPSAPTLSDLTNQAGNNVAEAAKAGTNAPKPKTFTGRILNPFSNNNYLKGSKDFLESNSLVAKFAFLVLVVIGFVFLLRLGTTIIGYFLGPDKNPILVKGMKDARNALTVKQDPNKKASKTIYRSKDQKDGIEFTWSVWMYIDDLTYKMNEFKHVFHKGNIDFNNEGISLPNNAPGLYIDKDHNNLVVIMNTFNQIYETVTIKDIPQNKWFLINIRVIGNIMDVFMNENVAIRHEFSSVVKQNYGDVYVNHNGGYSGLISNLRYHDYALSLGEIMNMSQDGPNKSMSKSLSQYPPYFSIRWYLENTGGIGTAQ